jgi:hypothetical protein
MSLFLPKKKAFKEFRNTTIIKKFLSIFLFLLISSFIISSCVPADPDEPELDLIRPSSQNYLTNEDEIRVQLRCENIDEMRVNSQRLSRREVERLCSRTSLYFDLDQGDNEFYFEGISTEGGDYDRTWLRLNVTYQR